MLAEEFNLICRCNCALWKKKRGGAKGGGGEVGVCACVRATLKCNMQQEAEEEEEEKEEKRVNEVKRRGPCDVLTSGGGGRGETGPDKTAQRGWAGWV